MTCLTAPRAAPKIWDTSTAGPYPAGRERRGFARSQPDPATYLSGMDSLVMDGGNSTPNKALILAWRDVRTVRALAIRPSATQRLLVGGNRRPSNTQTGQRQTLSLGTIYPSYRGLVPQELLSAMWACWAVRVPITYDCLGLASILMARFGVSRLLEYRLGVQHAAHGLSIRCLTAVLPSELAGGCRTHHILERGA